MPTRESFVSTMTKGSNSSMCSGSDEAWSSPLRGAGRTTGIFSEGSAYLQEVEP